MSPEQTKSLKQGDTIFIRASFIKADDGGNVIYSVRYNCGGVVELTHYALTEDAFPRYTLQTPQPDESITGSFPWKEAEKQKETCISCRSFLPYNDGDPNGRCLCNTGSYCSHTIGSHSCKLYKPRKEEV